MTAAQLPFPWVECEMCREAAALPTPGTLTTLCHDCARLEALTDVAAQSLEDAVGPHLGAWAAHWQQAGVPLRELLGVLELAADYHTREDLAEPRRLATLRALGMKYALPPVTPSPPARVTLDLTALPVIEGHSIYTDTFPGTGQPRRLNLFRVRFPDGKVEEALTLAPGPDVLLILNALPTGDALLYETGIHGRAFPQDYPAMLRRTGALRVPAQFLPDVRAALGYWGSAEGSA